MNYQLVLKRINDARNGIEELPVNHDRTAVVVHEVLHALVDAVAEIARSVPETDEERAR